MDKVWKIDGRLKFKEVGRNKFLIEFQSTSERSRVLRGRPWSFDKNPVCLQECEASIALRDMTFSHEPFWVQFHNVPFAGINKIMGERLGGSIGEVMIVDVDEQGRAWDSFLRVKVMVDSTKPLARGRVLNMKGSHHWIPFKYERLPTFCFHCGAILHGKTSCDRFGCDGRTREDQQLQYGP
ncbi:uncharacterized protein At4g02000-like [Carya illinoinensis]|uniref:uncharacterized protein At4g02000-like n=1 Tax=Carya illinoinensis TaxID=32201 RepID=UPI001C721C9A|nr:uncharacterized protein At4g02000-like [Carya illinoinensis]